MDLAIQFAVSLNHHSRGVSPRYHTIRHQVDFWPMENQIIRDKRNKEFASIGVQQTRGNIRKKSRVARKPRKVGNLNVIHFYNRNFREEKPLEENDE